MAPPPPTGPALDFAGKERRSTVSRASRPPPAIFYDSRLLLQDMRSAEAPQVASDSCHCAASIFPLDCRVIGPTSRWGASGMSAIMEIERHRDGKHAPRFEGRGAAARLIGALNAVRASSGRGRVLAQEGRQLSTPRSHLGRRALHRTQGARASFSHLAKRFAKSCAAEWICVKMLTRATPWRAGIGPVRRSHKGALTLLRLLSDRSVPG